ncbi:type VII secretion integral membrane protein EccD [Nocardia sp. NPDC059091]|uniref:type VII secretion integral membrane protein EccD n=1 Tax=unclassified Nocardia TaxID=2637762 RepID=UPI003681FF03
MSTAFAPAPSAAGAGAPAEVALARVAIMVATYQVDVVVPTKFSIETFIEDLLAVLAGVIDDETVDFTPQTGQWTLARPGQTPIPRWRTLADHEITDGALLMLATVESSELFEPVVEDITDALALTNEREFAEFDTRTATLTSLAAFGGAATAVAAMLVWSWTRTASPVWCTAPALVLAASSWLAAILAPRRNCSAPTCIGLALSALPLIFAAAAMIVPRPYGEPGFFTSANIAAGSALTAVAAGSLLRSIRGGTTVLAAAAVSSLVCAVITGAMTYFDLSVRQAAGGGALIGLILLSAAPRLAVVAARIRPPDLPDPGREVEQATLTDIFDAESAGNDESEDEEAQRRRYRTGVEARARLAVTTLRGLIIATVVVLACSIIAAVSASPGGVREIVLAAAVSGLLLMRPRWYPDRVQAIMLVVGAVVVQIGVGFVLTAAYTTAPARAVVVLVATAVAVAGCFAGTRLPGVRLSPVVRRIIDLIEYALILAVPVLACWIMGIYTAVRGI